MSDIMKSIPFGQLMEWILNEYKKTGQVFGIQKAYVADQSKTIEIFGRKLENPVGPAAGPHTQLAQNLVAAYVAGARFFELKPGTENGWTGAFCMHPEAMYRGRR